MLHLLENRASSVEIVSGLFKLGFSNNRVATCQKDPHPTEDDRGMSRGGVKLGLGTFHEDEGAKRSLEIVKSAASGWGKLGGR